ncbi:MAG TPA: hypothetical protein VG537_08430 [Candidatus Kapabacteria bacterium]|nr:hypothetical protein [Candidatus Kapabacteria bacterium]
MPVVKLGFFKLSLFGAAFDRPGFDSPDFDKLIFLGAVLFSAGFARDVRVAGLAAVFRGPRDGGRGIKY